MKLLSGEQAVNQQEATDLVLRETGSEDLSNEIIDMFSSIAKTDAINNEAEKIISSAVRNRYGNKCFWRADRWFIPIPALHFDSKDIPHLTIDIQVYLVTTVNVSTKQGRYSITLIGAIGKPETLVIPMIFLHAFLEKDMGRFAVIARDAVVTQWDLPGTKPVSLPNDFIEKLAAKLKWQSVVDWLLEFGPQGRYVAPLVAGYLIGLAFQGTATPVPVNQQPWTYDELVKALESMAYHHNEAVAAVNKALPYLRADMTLQEAILVVFKVAGNGLNSQSNKEDNNNG